MKVIKETVYNIKISILFRVFFCEILSISVVTKTAKNNIILFDKYNYIFGIKKLWYKLKINLIGKTTCYQITDEKMNNKYMNFYYTVHWIIII